MDPFRRGPLLALNYGAAPMQALYVRRRDGMEAEEQQRVALYRFNCQYKANITDGQTNIQTAPKTHFCLTSTG
jgi:hypothetical protein